MSLVGRRFSFWISIVGIIICLSDYMGSGFANIFIRLIPPINVLADVEPMRHWMFDFENNKWGASSSILLEVNFLTYVILFITWFLVGLFIDILVKRLRRIKQLV
ncbi:hypothetical protein P5G65_18785 [Paenibacillus chondroitinus]|uniref:Uncharacterized protein n=1 Tax=Paenibacillus chondroitinus TaxID=59842 RepID=A0ABU6DGF0_9BACL|nr:MULTISPECIES: hypothetical protein [Paenibacillus]MCY9657310.1 hypothetical protein [Paenibacillus anseongense]MEB4795951.1 hypothetical protein [Paenibacillus chondroitinus]